MSDMNKTITFEEAKELLGIIPMTNEEWLHTMNTVQLAEFLNDVSLKSLFAGQMHDLPKLNGTKQWVVWLKQTHKE